MSASDGGSAPAGLPRWCPVLAISKLPDGEVTGILVGDDRIALYRIGDEVLATGDICTHAFALLSEGWIEEGVVECPLHGGRFDIRTGEACDGPVSDPIATYPVRVSDGMIEVEL